MLIPGVVIDTYEWRDSEVFRLRSGERWRITNQLVDTYDKLEAAYRLLSEHRELSYDTEGSGLKPHLGARICGHAFTVRVDERALSNFYIPVRHQATTAAQLDPHVVADWIRALLSTADWIRALLSTAPTLRGHNLKHDALSARADGIELADCPWVDTSLLLVANNENEPNFKLKDSAGRLIYAEAATEEDEMDRWMHKDAHRLRLSYKKRKRVDFGEISEPTYLERYGYARTPIPLCGVYACHDTALTWLLAEYLLPRVKGYSAVLAREHAIAKELLLEMEWWGSPIDVDEIHRVERIANDEVLHWKAELNRLCGAEVDTTDNGFRALFFTQLGMTPAKETAGGLASVDAESRKLLQNKYPEHAAILKAASKLGGALKVHTTYAASWIPHITPEGRVHSSYNQIEQRDEEGVPKTGRLGSSSPNAQNINNKNIHSFRCGCRKCVEADPSEQRLPQAELISIRKYYLVPPGFVHLYIDLSQIELRVLAWFTQDPRLLYCYANDLDVHQLTADDVTAGDRNIAKQVVFGNSYGMTEHGLSKRLPYYWEDPDRALQDASLYLERFFKLYANVLPFRDRLAEEMKRNGGMFVNPFGRPRRIPTIRSSDRKEYQRALRMMMSSIISGTAADMLKIIALRCGKVLRDHYGPVPHDERIKIAGATPRGRIMRSIHDEKGFELPLRGCAEVIPSLLHAFTDWPEFEAAGVPIRAAMSITTTHWGDKQDLKLLADGTFALGKKKAS